MRRSWSKATVLTVAAAALAASIGPLAVLTAPESGWAVTATATSGHDDRSMSDDDASGSSDDHGDDVSDDGTTTDDDGSGIDDDGAATDDDGSAAEQRTIGLQRPRNVEARLTAFDTAVVTWRAARRAGDVTGYVVALSAAGSSTRTVTVGADERTARFADLVASTRYRVTLTAVGDGTASRAAVDAVRTPSAAKAAKVSAKAARIAAKLARKAQQRADRLDRAAERAEGAERHRADRIAADAAKDAARAAKRAQRADDDAQRAEDRDR